MRTCPFLLAAAALLPFAGTSFASDSAWNVNASGNFTDAANWTAGVPGLPAGNTTSTDVATFNRSTINATTTVTVDAPYNIGGITFNNNGSVAGGVYTIFGNATNALTLSANAVIQNIGSQTGGSTLNATLVLSGNTTFSNTNGNGGGNLQFGVNAGVRSMAASGGLGNVFLTFTGNNTSANNLAYSTYNQGAGTTLGIIKDGTGSWQLNNIGGNMTGGILVKNGTLGFGQSAAASLGTITLGDGSSSGNIVIGAGSGVTINNNINVASSSATTVVLSRTGGSGAGSYAGNITLSRDLVLRHGTNANQALALTAASAVTGSGNLVVNTTVAGAVGAVNLQGSVNMTGQLINQSSTGTGMVTVSGAIGANVTGVVQNSATSNMTLSNAANAYTGNTTITAGTLFLSGSGNLGDSNLVMNGGTLNVTGITGAGYTIASGKSVTGIGTIVTTGKDFTVNGTLAPGASPGTLNVTGNMTLGSTAISNFEINGTTAGQFDLLAASGLLTLGGTLNLTTGYAAALNDTVTLFTAGTFAGSFSSITGTDLGGGLLWDTSALSTTGAITVVPEPATWALVGLGLGATLFFRRRRV